jgi:hypothetical protein
MIELRFHRDLYDLAAVDEASKIYGPYGAIDVVHDDTGCLVRLTVSADTVAQGIDERTLGAEMSNYALGMTIEAAHAAETSAGAPEAR